MELPSGRPLCRYGRGSRDGTGPRFASKMGSNGCSVETVQLWHRLTVMVAATAIVVAPFAALPLIGVGTAIAAGIGVGTGVAMGASQAKDGVPDEDDF